MLIVYASVIFLFCTWLQSEHIYIFVFDFNRQYGWCEETGEPIGLNRLIARPTANLSLEAQERRELRQKLFGD